MGRKIMSTGVGPSKLHAQPQPDSLAHCTVGGIAWEDLPEAVRARMPYELTDQGLAEKAASKPRSPHRVIVGDDLDKQLRQRLDAALRGDPNNRPSTALKEVADQYVRPGMTPVFQNPDLIRTVGTQGYKPVIDEDGDPVRVGEMILTEIPTEISHARILEAAAIGKERLAHIDQVLEESSGRVAREGLTPAALSDLSSISGSDFSGEEDTNPLTE